MREKENLAKKVVAIVGVGGTGCSVANLLARSGLKKLILIDGDVVEEKNLGRQLLYGKEDVGKIKVNAAKERLKGFCDIETRNHCLDASDIDFSGVDLVIDCTDNIETRLLINDYCKKKGLPWIYTGAIREFGSVWFISPEGPCFQCLNQEKKGERCCAVGVNPAVVAVVGNVAASLALQHLKNGRVERGMVRFNLQNLTLQKFKVKRSQDCEACRGVFNYLAGKTLSHRPSSCQSL